MDLSGGTRASALDPDRNGTEGFGRRTRKGGKRDFGSKSAERRTAGASAPSGSPPGKPDWVSAPFGLRRKRSQGFGLGLRNLETALRECLASQARSDAKGQWGPAAMPAPITVWGSPYFSGPKTQR